MPRQLAALAALLQELRGEPVEQAWRRKLPWLGDALARAPWQEDAVQRVAVALPDRLWRQPAGTARREEVLYEAHDGGGRLRLHQGQFGHWHRLPNPRLAGTFTQTRCKRAPDCASCIPPGRGVVKGADLSEALLANSARAVRSGLVPAARLELATS